MILKPRKRGELVPQKDVVVLKAIAIGVPVDIDAKAEDIVRDILKKTRN